MLSFRNKLWFEICTIRV